MSAIDGQQRLANAQKKGWQRRLAKKAGKEGRQRLTQRSATKKMAKVGEAGKALINRANACNCWIGKGRQNFGLSGWRRPAKLSNTVESVVLENAGKLILKADN
jgi:hypothetical protein